MTTSLVAPLTRPSASTLRRRAILRRVFLAAVVAALLGVQTAPAAASEYSINACLADPGNFSTQAFSDFATRGMMWKRACDPLGPGLRGLVTSNVPRPGRVARGSRSGFVLNAPPGTRFSRLTWSGQARRRDCRYALQLWASRPDGPPTPIKNVRANKRCPRIGYAQAAAWPRPRTYNIGGATKIVQRIVCVGKAKTPHCSSRGLNYIRTFKAQATVVDVSKPAVTILKDNAFTRGQWVRGKQSVTYAASDNVGVKFARAISGGLSRGKEDRVCDYALPVPCPSGSGSIVVDTTLMPEGTQSLVVDATDAASNVGAAGPITARVDNTAPGAVAVGLEGGDVWRNENTFDVSWTNPAEGDRAPINVAHLKICSLAGTTCSARSSPGANISSIPNIAVPGPGEWQLRVWRGDAAGNQEPTNASVPVTLRFDPDPPELAFDNPSPSDPTLVTVSVADKLSGLAGGGIEMSRHGSGVWQTLPTQVQGGRLVARIDDSSVPPGIYQLRATARDRASNLNSTDRRATGEPMTLNLPLRISTAVRAGVVTERVVRRVIKRGGKRRKVRRRIKTVRQQVAVEYGDRLSIAGRLENRDGQPIPGAPVEVFSKSSTSAEQLVSVVTTDAQGKYSYQAVADATRTLRFVFRGNRVMLPSQSEVNLITSATSTIRATPRRLRNGQSVRFTGVLRSLPAPPAGKLVELQVVLSGRWQTFRTTRTGPDGSWAVRYAFRRTCGLTRYRFRARLPAEAGYAFQTGRTKDLSVRVRGPRCR
jgi:hypothetical protein